MNDAKFLTSDWNNGYTALKRSIQNDDPATLRRFIEDELGSRAREFFNERPDNERYISPLLVAVNRKDPEIVALLLDAGADLEICGADGTTPLFQSYHNRDLPMAEFLIGRGANLQAINKYGTRVFDSAMACGDLPTIERFLALGLPLDFENPSRVNTLHRACAGGNVETLKWVLARTAYKLDQANESGQRPIDYASSLEVFRFCLEQMPGLEPNIAFTNDDQSIHFFARENRPEIVEELLDRGVDIQTLGHQKSTVLHCAAGFGDGDFVRRLLQRGAKLEARNSYSYRPLHWAAETGDLETIRALVEAGAKLDVKTSTVFIINEMQTPLYIAIGKRHEAAAIFLLERGADPNVICDTSHGTALTEACRFNQVEVVKALLTHGANPNGVNKPESSGIDYYSFPLARVRSAEVVDLLVAAGADVNATNCHGATALHVLADLEAADAKTADGEGQIQAVAALLRHGADVHRTDGNRQTPQSLARCVAITRLLMEASRAQRGVPALSAEQASREGEQSLYRRAISGFVQLFRGESPDGEDPVGSGTLDGEFGKSLFDCADQCAPADKFENMLELLRHATPADVNYLSPDSFYNEETILHRVLESIRDYQDEGSAKLEQFVEAVDLLLERQANVKAIETLRQDSLLHTFLRALVHLKVPDADLGSLEKIAVRLLDGGVDLAHENEEGCRPLDLARSMPMLNLLKQRGATFGRSNEALFYAIEGEDEADIVALLGAGIPVECRSRNGDTPLLLAARVNKPAMLDFFRQRGADLGARAAGGKTLLHAAASEGALDSIEWILANTPADLNGVDEAGCTPLCDLLAHSELCWDEERQAAERAAAISLVERGARIDITTTDGRTPLDFADTKKLKADLKRAAKRKQA